MNKLTGAQKRVLAYIVARRRATGMPPTVREIAAHFGYKSPNNARQHLRLIEQKGYIRRLSGKARGIEVLTAAEPVRRERWAEVPLVGRIAAGAPLEAIENRESTLRLDPDLFSADGVFALRVKGDSMKDAGILDGDLAIIRRQPSVEQGEIAAVIVDGEATLKRFSRAGNRVVLRAENPAYADMAFGADTQIEIVGRLIGVVRKC
ncbi:MAG: transcriptional repressor LexA [Kiritimatiellae bacterium]|nr:transcriptional repressor LexA [Kiritimatiellia bacterium]